MNNSEILSPKVKSLYEKIQGGDTEALGCFWKEIESTGAPLIEDIKEDNEYCLVTALWKETEHIKSISVFGEMFGMDTKETRLTKLLNTNLWYRTLKVKRNARSFYIFFINEPEGEDVPLEELDIRTDPLNPKIYSCIVDEKYPDDYYLIQKDESVVELPDVEDNPWVEEREEIEKGSIIVTTFKSKVLHNERRIWTYTPAGYDHNQGPYGLILFTDGWDYVNVINTPTILDNLIAEGQIPPTCAVFVDTKENREIELTCNDDFVVFLLEELYPWINQNYNITTNPKETVIAGFSYGGLTAAYVGLKHSRIFGKILAQSGGFSWQPNTDEESGWIINRFKESHRLPLDFYLSFGIFEMPYKFMYDGNKRMIQVLKDKGYKLYYEEFPGGHNCPDCQMALPNALKVLLNKEQ